MLSGEGRKKFWLKRATGCNVTDNGTFRVALFNEDGEASRQSFHRITGCWKISETMTWHFGEKKGGKGDEVEVLLRFSFIVIG